MSNYCLSHRQDQECTISGFWHINTGPDTTPVAYVYSYEDAKLMAVSNKLKALVEAYTSAVKLEQFKSPAWTILMKESDALMEELK